MSHISSIKIEVKDLESLAKAAQSLGLNFLTDQKTFKWYGKWMNDFNAPEAAVNNGFDPKKFGQCEHAIAVPGNDSAYEVGVVRNPNGAGYTLLYDNWGSSGRALEALIGKDAVKLKQAYGVTVATKALMRDGYRVQQQKTQDGRVRLVARK